MLERASVGWPPPLRDLKDLLFRAYVEASTPSLDEIAEDISADDELPGAPGRDTIRRCISSPDVPASQADTVAVAVVLARRARWDAGDVAARVRELWVEARMHTPVGRLLTAYDERLVLDDLEVHPAVIPQRGLGALGLLPAYIPREADRVLAEATTSAADGRSNLVILVGGSSTGKTRSCWEAVRKLPDGWRLWHPIEPDRTTAFIAEVDQVGPQTVVWINEAQHYLLPEEHSAQVSSSLRALLNDPDRAPVLVVGTLWREHWDTLTRVPDPRMPDPYAQARQLLKGKSIEAPEAFSEHELGAVRGTAANDPRLTEALHHAEAGRIAQYLAGGPALIERYNHAPPGAKALIKAALDVLRLGHGEDLPRALLEAAAPGYLSDAEWDALPDDWPAVAWDYVTDTRACRGARSPLYRRRPQRAVSQQQSHYCLADFLKQRVPRSTAVGLSLGAQDDGPTVPGHLWNALTEHSAVQARVSLAGAAQARGYFRVAMRLYYGAAEAGDSKALRPAADLLRAAGRTHEAITWYMRGAEGGDVLALGWAVLLLTRSGRTDEAVVCHQRTCEASDADLLEMEPLLERMKEIEDADAWVQHNAVNTARVSLAWAPLMLRDGYAWLLQEPDRVSGALRRLRAHAEAGNAGALIIAAELLGTAGRKAEGRSLRAYGWEPGEGVAEPWEVLPPRNE
ncbi:hypothetical protein [Streptomyces sp. RG80]|uniref:hypothetical protein n=1 Tax=Streptomyces sp. RG80 TaxID=3157340 RepID=UPI003390019E